MKKEIKEPELELEDALDYASDSIDLETLEGADEEDSYEQRAMINEDYSLLDDPSEDEDEIPDWSETDDEE